MQSFGELLRKHRRRSQDPLRGGPLTQARLGELLGHYLGGAGYTGAAVSDWELNKSKINADDRLLLVSLVDLLVEHRGLIDLEEANRLLYAGNYRPLDKVEMERVFPKIGEQPAEEPASPLTDTEEHAIALTTERKKQLVLLSKVMNFWVRGVLEHSIEDATLIDLARQRCDEAINHPWRELIGPAVYENRASPDGILDVFRGADKALLILGEPGAGKTTTMLQLTKKLGVLAEYDPNQPIPVVLNLVSWTEKREPIADWVVEDLVAKYQIPRRLGREWLNNHELILLLDGFDEVPPRYRAACVKAINYFRESFGLIGLVICSRTEPYAACGVQLRLGGAILLCQLTATQVDVYLSAAGPRLFALRAAIKQNIVWQEMAQSPLMLSVMRAAYSDASMEELPNPQDARLDEIEVARRHLFDMYVRRMFQRRSQNPPYSTSRTKDWLAWLARKMTQHNQTVFLVEKLQPSWLPSRLWQWLYLLIAWLVTGLYGGVLMWLFLLLLREVVPWPIDHLSGLMDRLVDMHIAQAAFLSILLSNLLLGLLVGIINSVFYESRRNREEDTRRRGRQGWRQIAIVGLVVGFVTALLFSPAGARGLAIAWGIAEAVMFMIISRYAHGRNYNTEIRTVEALSWSWLNAAKGLGYGFLLGALAEIIETWLFGYNGIMNTAFTFLPAGVILGGLRGSRVEVKNRPNEGIRLSFRNAIIAALMTGLSLLLITWIVSDDPDRALITGLLLAFFALPLFGLSNVTKHYLVRLLLWYKKRIPWRFVHFLDYGASLVLLRKVGGGYIFMHRMLQEYFGN